MSKTRDEIKAIAVRLVEQDGLINLSRSGLCGVADFPDGSFPAVMGCTFSEFVEELRAMGLASPLRKVTKSRTNPTLRKEHILDTSVALAKGCGCHGLTLGRVAEAAGVSPSLVSQYFSMSQLKNSVMRQAIRHEIPEIVAMGLANGNERAKAAPAELKQKAMKLMFS